MGTLDLAEKKVDNEKSLWGVGNMRKCIQIFIGKPEETRPYVPGLTEVNHGKTPQSQDLDPARPNFKASPTFGRNFLIG